MHGHSFQDRLTPMTRPPLQFGIASLMWLVAFAAFNCWLFSLGAWGGILAAVIDKHVLVAYLCMKADVDRRPRAVFRLSPLVLERPQSQRGSRRF